MYPDLSYFFYHFFGLEPDGALSIFKTFGLFLVLAILSAAFVLQRELKRKAREGKFSPTIKQVNKNAPPTNGEIISNVFWGWILGFKLPYAFQHLDELKANPASVIFSIQGNWLIGILAGVVMGGYFYWLKIKKEKLPVKIGKEEVYPHDLIGQITILAAISGVIGAKIFALLEDIPSFLRDPIGSFFSGSGLAIYGGLIVGFIAVGLYLKKRNIPVIHVLDAVAPALILAYGVGRLGCHFSGDGDWGIPNLNAIPSWWFLPDWLWAYNYPHNVINEGIPIEGCTVKYCQQLAEAVYPTPIYESLMSFSIFGILMALRKKLSVPGMLFFIYLMFNGIERFFIEKIRINIVYDFAGIKYTQAEFISTILFIIGVIGFIVLWRRGNRTKAAD